MNAKIVLLSVWVILISITPVSAQYELYYAIELQKSLPDTSVRSNVLGSILPKSGNIEAQVLIALTDVIIERAKEELASAYFDNFASYMNHEIKVPISNCSQGGDSIKFCLKDLFPNTYITLSNSRSIMSPLIGNIVKVAVERDFKNLPLNLEKINFPASCKQNDFFSVLNITRSIYNEANSGKKVPEILMVTHPKSNELGNLVMHSYNLMCCISESLLDKNLASINWYNEDELNGISPKVWATYVMLMRGNKSFTTSYYFVTGIDLEKSVPDINSFRDEMLQFFNTGKRIDNFFSRKEELPTQPSQFSQKEFNPIPLSMELATQLISFISLNSELRPNIDNLRKSIVNILDIIKATNENAYNEVLISTMQLFKNMTGANLSDTKAITYLFFMAQLASAKDTEEAKKVIEAVILPVGSYKLKREVDLGITLNSYIGAYGGIEMLTGNVVSKSKSSGYLTPFLPVGIDLSRSGCYDSNGKGHSLSLFISAIDLGAVLNYRFKNSSDTLSISEVPDFKLKNIFAPGLYVIWGIKNSPISIGFGGQYAPALREITSEKQVVKREGTAIRVGIMVTVDIPLLNISTGKNKIKKP